MRRSTGVRHRVAEWNRSSGDVDGGELVGASPADEVSGRVAVGGAVVGESLVEVGLSVRLQGEVVSLKPGKEGDGRAGALTR